MPRSSYTPETAFQEVAEFEHAALQALRVLRRHVEQSAAQVTPATGWAPMPDILAKLKIDEWITNGGMQRSSFAQFLEGYLQHSVQFRHPGYIAHQVSVPDYPAALGA
ncbi:MAG: hypothetical protein HKN70_04060, partial [Gammaproteobacteria bacterium]|nr:hypothetical protein [Gammaproteobacteria bacterium]